MSVESSTSAIMPSAEELSFLLDFDENQMSRDGKRGTQTSQACSRVQAQDSSQVARLSMNFFGGGSEYDVNSNSLHAIANTLPSACDLATDLSVADSAQSSGKAFPQAALSTSTPAPPTSEPRSFPWKLHEMLSEVERNGFQDIISWEPDGMAFKVHDCQLFVDKVMPLYFDQSRYESFRRQLRKYGFSRLHKDRYRGAYHHKYFQKANRQLCKYITRGNKGGKSKSKGAKAQTSSEKTETV